LFISKRREYLGQGEGKTRRNLDQSTGDDVVSDNSSRRRASYGICFSQRFFNRHDLVSFLAIFSI